MSKIGYRTESERQECKKIAHKMLVAKYDELKAENNQQAKRIKELEKLNLELTDELMGKVKALCKFHNKNFNFMEKEERIKYLESENEQLEKWQIKPTEAICLTGLACRYKKVFRND